MKNKLECAYHISKFKNHEKLKKNILKFIDEAEYTSPISKISEVNISKTDWHISTDMSRKWLSSILEELMSHMLLCYQELGYENFTVTEMWFQQYLKNSEHGWHIHGGNFTNVYYLELPEGTPKTQIISPFDQKTFVDIEIEEGDTLIFPSFTLHKAPKNTSNNRKTIVSFNTNVGYPDSNYKK